MYPSYLAFCLSGLIIAYVIYMLTKEMYSGGLKTTTTAFATAILLLLLSIAIGVHGLAHAYAEVNFGFNPLEGKWGYSLK